MTNGSFLEQVEVENQREGLT